ncbi:hypothetical protein WA026_007798 [Henosepilachna vigintioctopunctata]|uniref:Uncharacterized protein n=1 Tax=Henosepilachna vigintioctopunctata TaxID=420089 RepID=A0AAW1U408_9CUCU
MKLIITAVLVVLVSNVLSVPLSSIPKEKTPEVLLPPILTGRTRRQAAEKSAPNEELEASESAYGLWPYAWPYYYPYVYKVPYVIY